MLSLVSAVAARIVFIEGTDARYVDADDPGAEKPTTLDAVPALLADAYDVKEFKNTTVQKSFEYLLAAWNGDRALRMLDIILDLDSDVDETEQAAEYFSHLIADPVTNDWVKNCVFAVPLEKKIESKDLAGRIKNRTGASDFVGHLLAAQESIRQTRLAWVAVPDSVFGTVAERAKFEFAAVSLGAFRKMSEALSDPGAINDAVLGCYLALRGQPNSRAVVGDWTKA